MLFLMFQQCFEYIHLKKETISLFMKTAFNMDKFKIVLCGKELGKQSFSSQKE